MWVWVCQLGDNAVMASVSAVPVRQDTTQSWPVWVWVCQLGENAVTLHPQTHSECLVVANLCCHNIPSVSLIQTLYFVPVSILMQILCSFQFPNLNTFTAIVHLSRFNNSCLKSPASTLVDLILQSRSFSFNQLCDLSLLAGNLYSSWRYPIHSLLCLHCDIMNLCLSLCSEGQWAVSGYSL